MASIHFEAAIDAKKLYKEFDKIEQQIRQVGDVTNREVSSMEKSFNRLGTAAGAFFTLAAGKQFISELVSVRGEFQQLGISLETILKDKEKADKLMANVVEFAAYTPFELTEVGQSVKKLLAFNVEAEDSLDILRRLGDVASGLSTPLDGLVQAYGKVKAKGKLQAEEMNLFLERGVPLVSALAEKYGVAQSAIYDMASKRQIHFEDLHEVIVNLTNDGGMFANMMEKQALTLPGQISNLKDAVAQMLDEIGQSNEGILYGGIGAAKKLVDNYDLVATALKRLIAAYGISKAASITLNIIQQVKAARSLARALKGATTAQKALNLAQKASPIGLAAAAITTLIVGLIALAKRTREAKDEAVAFAEVYDGISEGVRFSYSVQILEMENLKQKLEEVKGSREGEQLIIKTINEKYDNHLDNLVNEAAAYGDVKTSIDAVILSMEKQMEVEILMEKMRAIKEKQMGNEALQKEYVGDYGWKKVIGQSGVKMIPEDVLEDLNKQARKVLEEVFEYKKDISTPFYYLRARLSEDAFEYMEEMERLRVEIREIEEGLYEDDEKDSKFDSKIFQKSIKESKKAFEEWEKFKETSRADELQGDYQHYLDLGDNYKEYLEVRLKQYQGNHAAVMIITKELAAIEVKEIQAVKEAAEELLEQMDGMWEDVQSEMDKALDKYVSTSTASDTKAIKDREKEIQASLRRIDEIRQKYAKGRNQYKDDLEELETYHKQGLISHKDYEEETTTITREEWRERERIVVESMAFALNELSGLIRDIDEEVAQSINTMANLFSQAFSFTSSIETGDIFGSITSGVQVIGSLISLFRNDAPESHAIQISKAQQAYDDLNKQMDITNRLLDDQYKLLDRLNGEEWLSGAVDTTKMLNDALAETVTQLYLAINEGKTLWDDDFVWTINWSVEDFQKFIDENLVGEEADKLQAIIDQYKALQEQLVDIGEEIRVNLTGTTSDAISDTLSQVFANGEASAEKFTQTFEDLMKQAVIESFKKQFIESQMQGFYDAFAVASEDGLDGSEITNLQQIWEQITQNAQEGWEALQNNFDFLNESAAGSGEDPNSLSGSIRRELTEETGTLLAGYINSMRLDVREGVDIQRDMLGAMGNIEYNTYLTADRLGALSSIQADIREIRTQLTA